MLHRIKRLKLKAFRGATNVTDIEFDPKCPICLVFGENGTGKSSIVDAIDFVCNGKLGSLDYRKLGRGKTKEPFIPSVGKKGTDVLVELSCNEITWTAKHSRKGVNHCDTPDRPTAMVLRRVTLLEFVESDPAERYKALASYVAVQEVDDGEKTLREAQKAIESDYNLAANAVVQAEQALNNAWLSQGQPGRAWRVWAEEEARKDVDTLSQHMVVLSSIIQGVQALESRLKDLEPAAATEKIASDFYDKLKKLLDEAVNLVASGASELVSTLRFAKDYLKVRADTNECPVCQQPIDHASLCDQIQNRIDQMKRIGELTDAADNANRQLLASRGRLASAQDQTVRSARLLVQTTQPVNLQVLFASTVHWTAYDSLLPESEILITSKSLEQAARLLVDFQHVRQQAESELEKVTKTLNQHKLIRRQLETLNNKYDEAKSLAKLREKASQAVGIVVAERKRFVEEILASITDEVSRFYSLLHPNEAIGGVKLLLDPTTRGSLNFEGIFETESSAPPQAYYSESHLDTLGICIFLAIAKHFGSGRTLVILDDVFTSVDHNHLIRFLDLIHTEASNYSHLIITTHYQPWRDAYRHNRAPSSKIQILELLPWTIKTGIRHTRTKLVVDELVSYIKQEPIDRQIVASKAGILLEQLLDYITLVYECSLSRKASARHTLGDFHSAINPRLRKALKITQTLKGASASVETFLQAPIEELFSLTWIRNQVGCHFNLDVMTGNEEVLEFGKRVVDFANLLVCPDCGELPRNQKSGVDRKCRCGNTVLVPLEQPG